MWCPRNLSWSRTSRRFLPFYLVNWLVLRSRRLSKGKKVPGSNNSLSIPIASLPLNFAHEWKDRQKEGKGKSLLCPSQQLSAATPQRRRRQNEMERRQKKNFFRAVSQQRRKCTSFLPPLPPFFPLSPPCNFGTVEAVCGGEKIGGHASFIQHFYGTKSNNVKNTKDFQTAIFFKKYFFLVMQIILSCPFLRNRGIFFGGPP